MLWAIVLLEGEPPSQSQISLYLVPSIIPSILTSFPVLADEKHPHSMMLHCGDGVFLFFFP
jgi:hypothetical protein